MNLPDSAALRLLELARLAEIDDEVPAASMLLSGVGEILAESQNKIRRLNDPSAHSEITCIRKYCSSIENERVPSGTILLTTLEPCIMCTGAIIHARISRVVFLCKSDKGPGITTLIKSFQNDTQQPRSLRFNHYPEVIHWQKYESDASAMLSTFFQKRRRGE